MSNKGLLLFVVRTLLIPASLGMLGYAGYLLYKWWSTRGQDNLNIALAGRPEDILLAAILLVLGAGLFYLSVRPQPRVKTLLPEKLVALPDLDDEPIEELDINKPGASAHSLKTLEKIKPLRD